MTEKILSITRKAVFFLIVCFVFVLPIISLLQMSFTTDGGFSFGNYAELLQEDRTIEAIKNTLIISIGSTLIATIAGSFFAYLVAYTNIKRKWLLELLVLAPYIIPSYIITLSWSSFLMRRGTVNTILQQFGIPAIDIYTLPGIVLVMGICNIPVVYLLTVNMFRKIPRDMEWAARAAGRTQWEVIRKITLVQAMPAIAGGSILAFLAAIDNFSVPAFLGISSGIPVLSTYIYEKAISFGPASFNLAAALSVILSFIAIGGTILQGKMIKKNSGLESVKEDRAVRVYLSTGKRRLAEWGSLAVLASFTVIPVVSMILSAFCKSYGTKLRPENFTLRNFQFVFTNDGVRSAVINSLLLAAVTCVICIIIGTAIAYMKVRRNSAAARMMESAASLTYALPGIVLALAMIFHWTKVPGIYGTIKILIIAYATRYLVLQIKGSTTAMLSVESALEEAGQVCGAGKAVIWKRIMIPMMTKQVLSSSFLIFVAAMTELTLSSMLASAGTKTIGLTIFNLQQGGDYSSSAAMSAVIVFIVFAAYALSACLKPKTDEEMAKAAKAKNKGKTDPSMFPKDAPSGQAA